MGLKTISSKTTVNRVSKNITTIYKNVSNVDIEI
jgi:hypothetical protein